MSQGVA